jgi:hypothetical protein
MGDRQAMRAALLLVIPELPGGTLKIFRWLVTVVGAQPGNQVCFSNQAVTGWRMRVPRRCAASRGPCSLLDFHLIRSTRIDGPVPPLSDARLGSHRRNIWAHCRTAGIVNERKLILWLQFVRAAGTSRIGDIGGGLSSAG